MADISVTAKGRRIIEPFDYHGITLEDGMLERLFVSVRDYYLHIPNDDLLHGYRKRAGLPAPGKELGGWYTKDAGNVFPQIISGIARMYAATMDETCREKAQYLFEEWAKCIDPDGYFMYSDHPTSYQYFYEKMVSACLDMHTYCGNTNALGYLSRITDWAEKNLDQTRDYANACGDPRIEKHRWGEWYTTSESLYRAYLITGDERYKKFAELWEYTEFWDLFANKTDIHAVHDMNNQKYTYHAYSHVNTFASAAAAYLVKGDPRYLEDLKAFYDYLQENQTYVTGGYGPNEELMPHDRFVKSLVDANDHCEAQCGSWAGFKLGKYLMSFTGDAGYGDWIERMAYNLIGADIPMASTGQVQYYVYYHLKGAVKKLYPDGWACCTGTRPQAVADFHDLIYFKDKKDLYINLYVPSTLTWTRGDSEVIICQNTSFPESDTVEFMVMLDEPLTFGMKFRVPGWLSGPMKASLNGESVEMTVDGSHWATIEREWENGDFVTLTLPMGFKVSRLSSENRFPCAITYGPIVLAARSLDGNPSGKIDFNNLEECLEPSPGEPLSFHLASDHNILLRPYYAFKENEEYFMYFDPSYKPEPEKE